MATNPYINRVDVVRGNTTDTLINISDTTAAAADVAQGKYFYLATGERVQGTNQGGGGTSIVWGSIRGDATLAKSWTYDKLIHADEGVTIPSYTTTDTTLKSGTALTSESLNFSNYSYMLLYRFLATPVYSDSTNSNGRQIYWANSGVYNFIFVPSSAFSHGGTSASAATSLSQLSSVGAQGFNRLVYYNSGTSIRFAATAAYGAFLSGSTNPTVTVSNSSPYDTATLSITSPTLKIRGHNTYLNSTNWNKITDIRYQYIYELYRVPRSATVHGWEGESQFYHILDCANGNGTLT